MNILIVKLSAIGDVIHTLPALVALRRHYPQAHISWLVEDGSAEILEGHAALDELIVWKRREFQVAFKQFHWIRSGQLFSTTLRQVRRQKYDLIIDFQALLKSALWVALAKGSRKVGFGPGMDHSEGSHLALTEKIPAISMEVHALERGLKLLQAIGVPADKVDYQLPHIQNVEWEVEQFLEKAGIGKDDSFVVIHPMARWETKLWVNERFAEVADALNEQGIKSVFSGGPADGEIINQIASMTKVGLKRFDGQGGLRHLAALCHRAAVVLSTDTGPMHLAVAVGTPVVALFGPTASNRTGPFGSQHTVIRAGVSCSPCFRRKCHSTVVELNGCMKRIKTKEVVSAVLECLNRENIPTDGSRTNLSTESSQPVKRHATS